MARIETMWVRPKDKKDAAPMLINASDFSEDKHTKAKAPAPAKVNDTEGAGQTDGAESKGKTKA